MKRVAMFAGVIAMTLAGATAFADTTTGTPTGDVVAEPTSSANTNSTNKAAPSIHRSRSGQPSRVAAVQTAPAASASSAPQSEIAPAAASAAAPAEAAAPASSALATPLVTRPAAASKPLTLAPTNESAPFAYKLLAGIGIAAAAGLWLRKRANRNGVGKKARSRIDVLGRTSVGVRSELLVIDVEGTRLLVGMTPSAIQTLAVLDAPALSMVGATAAEQIADEEDEAARLSDIARRRQPAVSSPPPPPPMSSSSFVSKKSGSEVDELSQRVRSLLSARKSIPSLRAQVDPDKFEDGDAAIIAQRPSMLAQQQAAAAAATTSSSQRPSTPFEIPRRRSAVSFNAVSANTANTSEMPSRRRSSMSLNAVSQHDVRELLDETQSRRLSPRTSAVAGQAKGLLLALEEESALDVNPTTAKNIRLGDW